jgi:rhodanese-related sulfurtransferase
MKRMLFLTLALAAGFGIALNLAGCGDDDTTTQPGISEYDRLTALGDTYFTSYTTPDGMPVNVAAGDVYARMTDMDTGNDYYILDWRSAADFATAHIEGAVNVSASGDFTAVLAAVPAGKTVLNVCYTGQTASYATAYMNMLGYEAQNLKFGMNGWTADPAVHLNKWENAISNQYAGWLTTVAATSNQTYAKPDVSTGKSEAGAILRERARLGFGAGWKTIGISDLYNDIEINGKAGDYFVINYFPAATYGAGHIPGAIQFEPKLSLKSGEMLNTIPTDKKVVVYCYTGQTSAQVVAYLNALGYDAYSLRFGVNSICYDNDAVCTAKYTAASTNYPVVSGS